MAAQPIPVNSVSLGAINRDDSSACELLDALRIVYRVHSFYKLAHIVGVDAQYLQRWYRRNYLPVAARILFYDHIERKREQ